MDIFRYDHLLNDHPFFKKKNALTSEKVLFLKKTESEVRGFMCSFWTKLHQCYCSLLQIIPVIYKERNAPMGQKKIHTTSLKDTWTQLAKWTQAVLFLFP